ncbi:MULTISPECIES: LPS-assembly protein LptD [Comamonadaceae]|uniref:LPS-assembly protein LptD n=1 Tax=Comamonadaceae TaxID=80864 RepID=UPI002716C33D|nr:MULTISPECIES: LPS-assembly protein LptD [Comamonadaceae]MDO9144836.1 LPS-assembly protein LptD [Rhodoferax sp.]MDP3886976.1 LPS-assembly protein LptD [Hydrogenophaga sp.]
MPDTPVCQPRRHVRPLRLSVLATLLQSALVSAQQAVDAPLLLQNSPLLQETIAPEVRGSLPSFVSGEHITGRPDLETVVEGQAMLRRGDMVIKADRLEYNQPTDLAKARGHVRVNRAGNVYEGPLLELRLDTFEGFFNEPTYHFLSNQAHGQADRVDFLDEQRAVIHNATFTTCQRVPGPSWMPDWILKASTITLDNEENVGTATGALLSFKGVPLLPVPYLSFPLSEQRKSGVLPPTIGLDNVNGSEVSVPYYWNIAPNRDATITPTLMSKRGINIGTEFRYLEPKYSGEVQLDWMPADKLRDANRWGLNLKHQASLDSAWTNNGAALNLSLNRVSDDNYWRDFSLANSSLTQRLLANDASLSWNNGAWANSVRTLKWQTLQDVTAPIVPPYDRLPQLSTSYARNNVAGFNYAFNADYTRFQSDITRTGQANGQRSFGVLQASYPLTAPAGFLTPRVQLHASQYQFETPLSNGDTSASRVLPTFSLDSGLVFERDTQLFGRNLRQTLEPRAFYVHTPYRDQSHLPNYDSGANDFNLATIYTENAYVGNDRISDSNLLTLGVTTRWLDPATGAETARLGMAQRLRFSDQNVTLPGELPAEDRLSDLLLGGSVHWDPRWSFDGTVQFNPKTERSVRSTLSVNYKPGPYRTLSAAYRYQRNSSEQIDFGWQWPINDLWGDKGQNLGPGKGQGDGRWYSVGRLNYSMNERKLVNALVGFEYDASCWLGRIVLERLQTSTSTATQRIMFQLEFVGFTRLGVNPLKSLKDNIPGYQILREPGESPSRFSNYD